MSEHYCPECGVLGMHEWTCSRGPTISNVIPLPTQADMDRLRGFNPTDDEIDKAAQSISYDFDPDPEAA